MNYLVHLYLSDPDPEILLGNLVGDFVKGPLEGRYSPRIEEGIRQHRRLDSFAQTHEAFRASRQRIDARFGHWRGVMVDIFYDHILAREWDRHSPLPLENFTGHVYCLIEEYFPLLPPSFQKIAPRMISTNWLLSYRDEEIVALVLRRLSERTTRDTPLAEGVTELQHNRRGFVEDCSRFLDAAKSLLRM